MTPWQYFTEQAARLGVPVSDLQGAQFEHFHALLVKANETTNLTRIVDAHEAILKHYLDALLYLRMLPESWDGLPLRFIDVGAGAGIPGIPLLIMRPHWSGVLLDSVGKKVSFMQTALEALGLNGSRAIQARAEDLAHTVPYRDGFDLALARAVAALPELLELCLPFVKPQGLLVVSKGAKGLDELTSAQKALKTLSGQLSQTAHLELPEGAGYRTLFSFLKIGKTPSHYPRKPGIPHRKPIC